MSEPPALNAFNNRTEPKALTAFMTVQNLEAQQRHEWKRAIRDSILEAKAEKAADNDESNDHQINQSSRHGENSDKHERN